MRLAAVGVVSVGRDIMPGTMLEPHGDGLVGRAVDLESVQHFAAVPCMSESAHGSDDTRLSKLHGKGEIRPTG